MSSYYLYILLCDNASYYTGITNNLENRFKKHKLGVAAKYTRMHKPIKILIAWSVPNKGLALSIEHCIKSLSKRDKITLTKNPTHLHLIYNRANLFDITLVETNIINSINSYLHKLNE